MCVGGGGGGGGSDHLYRLLEIVYLFCQIVSVKQQLFYHAR